MEYTVRFLSTDSTAMRRGHLYVGHNRLSLVIDYNTPWLAEETGKVRFSRPSGDMLASLEFPGLKTTGKGGQTRISYALIYDDAVYAIFNQHPWPDEDDVNVWPYFVIETEGQRWLAISGESHGRSSAFHFALCDKTPANLQPYSQAMDGCLADPVGQITRPAETDDFLVKMPDGRLRQPQLILLALVFLIHQLRHPLTGE